MHYVSVCPSCIVSRIALADVSGHGRAVVTLSARLRELMQKYLAALEQTSLMRDLNEAAMAELDGVHYATMVAVGFHGRRGLLVMTNAGHPPAFWYRANRGEWGWFEPRRAQPRPGVSGTPLGLLPNVSYDRLVVKPEPGDLIVLYSDGSRKPSTLRAGAGSRRSHDARPNAGSMFGRNARHAARSGRHGVSWRTGAGGR